MATIPRFPSYGSDAGDLQQLLRALRLSTAATLAGAMITARGKPTSIAEALRVTDAVERALHAGRHRSHMTSEPNEHDATPETLGVDEIYG